MCFISRQYNRKKKAEPGTMCEDDLEKVEMPIDSMFPSANKLEVTENGDIENSPEPPPAPADLDEEIQKKPLVKLKAKTPAKAKPSKTLLQFSKKKRKRGDSEGSDADLDRTPPPSPPEEESGIEKRRSGRNTKRKKYVDDVQYNFSDEDAKNMDKDDQGAAGVGAMEDILGPEESAENSLGPDENLNPSGPNYAFIDPTAEDTMIVQIILASRTGTRELADDDEAVKKEVKKEEEKKPETVENGEAHDDEKKETSEEKIEEKETPEELKEETEEVKDLKDEKPEEDVKEDAKEESGKLPEQETKSPSKLETSEKKKSKTVEVEEYLVKFKNFSYLHCQWLTEEELLRGDKRVSQKIKRYIQKKEKSANMMDFCDDEPFNPDYIEVDRVLDSSVHTETDTNVSFK